ncbi:FAD-dependent oxidoreductase, partial [Streptomyces sp. NPDC006356]
MAQSRRAVVIGGGIGGLTAAAALHRSGWDVTVLERAPSLEPVGAA